MMNQEQVAAVRGAIKRADAWWSNYNLNKWKEKVYEFTADALYPEIGLPEKNAAFGEIGNDVDRYLNAIIRNRRS